jgi:hypothetical protein
MTEHERLDVVYCSPGHPASSWRHRPMLRSVLCRSSAREPRCFGSDGTGRDVTLVDDAQPCRLLWATTRGMGAASSIVTGALYARLFANEFRRFAGSGRVLTSKLRSTDSRRVW